MSTPREQDAKDTCADPEDTADSASGAPPAGNLAGAWGKALNAARDGWLDLPPKQESVPLLRLSAVLLRLSGMIYTVDESHIGSTINVDVPLCGKNGECVPVPATLLQFRAAVKGDGVSDQMPEQFGLWNVSGIGLVVAFRGTASYEDVLVDVNIAPTSLQLKSRQSPDAGGLALQVHAGMYRGVSRHLTTIQSDISAAAAKARSSSQVQPSLWLTGHSLGGGYANCAMLHLLKNEPSIFGGGGGCVTFGAPMVVYGEDAAAMYAILHKSEAAGHQAATRADAPFQLLNFVNGSDVVPRLLGSSFADIHQSILEYYPFVGRLTSASRATARSYHPFGGFHFILGNQVRSLPYGSTSSSSGGDNEYSKRVHSQLDISASVKAMLVPGAVKSPAHDHLLSSYTAGIRGALEAAAADSPPEQRSDSNDLSSLFRLLPSECPQAAGLHEGLGRSVGQAGWGLASAAFRFAGKAAKNYMSQPSKVGEVAAAKNAETPNAWGSWLKPGPTA